MLCALAACNRAAPARSSLPAAEKSIVADYDRVPGVVEILDGVGSDRVMLAELVSSAWVRESGLVFGGGPHNMW